MPSSIIRASSADEQTVTLITGDRVTLRDGAPVVIPGAGRTQIKFSVQRAKDHVRVVPEDAAEMIAAGQLDDALFDVTLLLDSGYGDRRRDDLPLIITRAPGASGFAPSVPTGVIVDRTLPALGAAAVRQPKANPGAALAGLRATNGRARGARLAGAAPAAPSKIWLDRIRKPSLDHSVPQIGGPAAHARGFTGAGVTVAVLDTGIDSTHPDLAGKVVAALDFTGDGGGVLDVVGHGTHVASIIAGTGAASNGQFAGVAPDATLVSGRVCQVFGCPDSAILAGMSWAVTEQHAKIVNLSLGGSDTPGIDPLEDAVDQLSAQFGALFVIAAGNDFFDSTIESPGSADAALTVGAVDRNDQLAFFSSRGPRNGDRAVKPEVTAPGVDIVAARAANVPPIGEPVGTSYMRLSGTSMATPHVAGAAALLLQQHADWTGTQLKAQLIASANPNPGLTAFQQGGGRIDVDRGTRQNVSADPPVLSLGVAAFPHDDDPLIVRTVHYRNGGSAAIDLSLTAALSRFAGGPTPPGMIQVEPSAISVPAGGTADVTVTVTTSGALADGLYSGALVATGGDVRVETPIGVDREVESFDLGIDLVDAQGAPAFAVLFINPANGIPPILFASGHASLRLARGRYAIDASGFGFPGAFLAYPRLDLDASKTVVFDASIAKPFAVDIGDPTVQIATTGWEYIDFAMGHSTGSFAFGFSMPGGHLGPEAPPDELVGMAIDTLSDSSIFGSPTLVYNLAHSERGHLPTGWSDTVAQDQFATVRARHAGADDEVFAKGAVPVLIDPAQGLIPVGFTLLNGYTGPFDRRERFFTDSFQWEHIFLDQRTVAGQPFPVVVAQESAFRDYARGAQLSEQWNQATFGPDFPAIPVFQNGKVELGSTASRIGDLLLMSPSMVADNGSPGRTMDTAFDHSRVSLFRDGVLFAERIDTAGGNFFFLPPEPSTYRYEQEIERPASLFELSPHVTVAWTFRSESVLADQPLSLPLPTMRFTPPVDQHNATSARVVSVPIAFDRPAGAAKSRIVSASLEASFDDGAHWQRVLLSVSSDHGVAVIQHPPGAKYVSLRGSARDVLGNQIEQTIIRAYGLSF